MRDEIDSRLVTLVLLGSLHEVSSTFLVKAGEAGLGADLEKAASDLVKEGYVSRTEKPVYELNERGQKLYSQFLEIVESSKKLLRSP